MTQPVLFHVGTALQNIGLALVLGGILTIGAFVAPVLFKQFPREAAGAAMTIVFKRYDIVLLVSVGLILLGETLRVMTTGWPKMGIFYRLAYGAYGADDGDFAVFGAQHHPTNVGHASRGTDHAAGHVSVWAALHQLIEKLYKIVVVFAAVLLGMASYAPPGLR